MNKPEIKSTSPSVGDKAPFQASAKPVPPEKGSKNIPFIATATHNAVMIPKARVGKQQPEKIPDTNVSVADPEFISKLMTATRALITDGKPVTEPCAKLKVNANKQIAEFRQHHFDTWAKISANLCELRAHSKLGGVYSFESICLKLDLPRTKCNRLADCHVRLIALPDSYQHALRELRKSATDDVIEKVKEVMADGVSEAQIKNSLSAKFSRKGQQRSPAEAAKLKFLSALAGIVKFDDRCNYLKAVMDEAARSVGWDFVESNSVVSIASSGVLKTAESSEANTEVKEHSPDKKRPPAALAKTVLKAKIDPPSTAGAKLVIVGDLPEKTSAMPVSAHPFGALPEGVTHHKKNRAGQEYPCALCDKRIVAGEQYYEWPPHTLKARRQHESHGEPQPAQLTNSAVA